jgi:large subunit ribosomal protein L17
MRHGNKNNNLGRKKAHRVAMLQNMMSSLIMHKRIETTLAKAKALRTYVEPLLTKSKDNTTHSRRVIFSHLQNKETIQELFGVVAPKIADRPGGYVRVIRLGNRMNDGADMALIELVDFNETYNPKQKAGAAQDDNKKRTRRSKKKSDTVVTEDVVVTETATETITTTTTTTTTTTEE